MTKFRSRTKSFERIVNKQRIKNSVETDTLVTDIASRIIEELGVTDDKISKEQFLAVIGKAHDQFYDSFTIGQ